MSSWYACLHTTYILHSRAIGSVSIWNKSIIKATRPRSSVTHVLLFNSSGRVRAELPAWLCAPLKPAGWQMNVKVKMPEQHARKHWTTRLWGWSLSVTLWLFTWWGKRTNWGQLNMLQHLACWWFNSCRRQECAPLTGQVANHTLGWWGSTWGGQSDAGRAQVHIRSYYDDSFQQVSHSFTTFACVSFLRKIRGSFSGFLYVHLKSPICLHVENVPYSQLTWAGFESAPTMSRCVQIECKVDFHFVLFMQICVGFALAVRFHSSQTADVAAAAAAAASCAKLAVCAE